MNEFFYSFELKAVYRANSFIYYLQHIPLLKKFVKTRTYANAAIKTFAKVLAFLYELATFFIFKFLYLFLIFVLPTLFIELSEVQLEVNLSYETMFQSFFFLTLIGAGLNSVLFNPSKDKYYAIVLMRMDAKKMALSEYFYIQLKNFLGMLIAVYLITFICPLPEAVWLIPFLVVGCKISVTALILKIQDKRKSSYNENKFDYIKLTLCMVLLTLIVLLPLVHLVMSLKMFIMFSTAAVCLGVFGAIYLFHYNEYAQVYKLLLRQDNIIFSIEDSKETVNKSFADKIEYEHISTNKSGFAYFNHLFIKRHKKMLTKTADRIALAFGFFLLGLGMVVMIAEPCKVFIRENLISLLPYSLFLMYLINRGESITKAMFINCDNAMLHYRFYRQPKAILAMFTERLKSLIMINIKPAVVLSVGLLLLLIITQGGRNIYDYVVLPLTILCLSVFFSVHYLVLYYLLQPYNSEVEMKNPLYQVLTWLTYFICYMLMRPIASGMFGVSVILVTLGYIGLALLAVYKMSPKTFRLK